MNKQIRRSVLCFLALVVFTSSFFSCKAQVWQWAVPVQDVISGETNDHPTAFLWIPHRCKYVRAVVVGQHNMLEEGILEHPAFRKAMEQSGIAIVWVTPVFSQVFDFHKSDTAVFHSMMQSLAAVSGYAELATAPVVPIGHSALATYPWNFGAWAPQRTLAIVSVHGDAPETSLTGYGRPNIDWGDKNIDGVPALFVMGEYEWWEDRLQPGFKYVAAHPGSAITFLADAGHGHFDYSDMLVQYISLFITKAAYYRLPASTNNGSLRPLKFVMPSKGWLTDRWHRDSLPQYKAGPYASYTGNRYTASWVFDKEMAEATEHYYATARGKQPQYLGFVQSGTLMHPAKTQAGYNLAFEPLPDGVSFHVKAVFTDSTHGHIAERHAISPLTISRICGPVKKLNDSTFSIDFYRMGFNNNKRSNVIWLIASNKGDAYFKSAVQQAELRFPLLNENGVSQQIQFDSLPNQKRTMKSIRLPKFSSQGLPIYYYIKQGPARVDDNLLTLTAIPPRAAFPLKVTVVAWQYGRSGSSAVQSAKPVERSFYVY